GITKTLRPFFSGFADEAAIANGTIARMSTSPSAVTAPVRPFFIELFIAEFLSTRLKRSPTHELRQRPGTRPLRSPMRHLLAGSERAGPATAAAAARAGRSRRRSAPARSPGAGSR